MKIISLSLAKSTIIDDVALNCAYTGVKSEDGGNIYERVATLEEDTLILSDFFFEMCGEITDKLKEFIISSDLSDENFNLVLQISGAYDDALTPSVKKDICNSLEAGITARWFQFTYPSRASEWREKSISLLNRSVSKLCQRRRPQRSVI